MCILYIHVFIQMIYLIAVGIFLSVCVCGVYFQVGMNGCSFPDLWMCYGRMNHWLQPDKRWVDMNL